jgi:hypothetical protein
MLILGAAVYITHISKENDHRAIRHLHGGNNCEVAASPEALHISRDVSRGGGDRTRPPNYKVPWDDGVAAARQFQLLILLTVNRSARNGRTEIWRS